MRRWILSIVLGAGLFPGLALAQDYTVSKPAPRPEVTAELNGGIGEFTGAVGDRSNIGPAYGATLGYSLLPGGQAQGEIGYQGFSSSVAGGGRISSNRVQMDLRAGPQLSMPIPWQPYATAGVAANFVGAQANAANLHSATEGEVPFQVGADFFTHSPVRVGLKGSYVWNPGVGGDITPTDPHPDSWQGALLAKGAF